MNKKKELIKTLILPLKKEYFNEIKNEEKFEEYRLYNDFWKKRLENKEYQEVCFTLGYPKKENKEKHLHKKYLGYKIKKIKHKHFGDKEVEVFAIQFE